MGFAALLFGFAAGFGLFTVSLRKRRKKPSGTEMRQTVRAELWRLMRLPPTLRSANEYELWRVRLRNEGLPLAVLLERHVVVALAEALDDLRDIFRTTEPGDELLREVALTLLPVYEASAGFPPLQEIDPREFQSSRLPFRMVDEEPRFGRSGGESLAEMKLFTETPGLRNYSTRLQPHLTENRDVPRTRPIGEVGDPPPSRLRQSRRTATSTEVESLPQVPTFTPPSRPAPTALPQGKLSKTLESILQNSKTDATALPVPKLEAVHQETTKLEAVGFGHPLRLASDFERPTSRLKREPPRDKAEEGARRAANAVGRTREWLGRLEVTIDEVRDGCDGFGIEFEEEFIQLELNKPLPLI